MKSFNNVTLIGRAKEQPKMVDGSAYFRVEVERPPTAKKKAIDTIPVEAHGKLAEICSEYISKGALVLVNGIIQNKELSSVGLLTVCAESINILEYRNGK